MEESTKIRNFTDLNAWKEGHKLVLLIYKAVKIFPKEETYALSDQMRRSAVSVTSCIAEGFSRKSPKDKIHFNHMALGSLTEVQNQVIIAKDLGYIEDSNFQKIYDQSILVQKLIFGMITYLRDKG